MAGRRTKYTDETIKTLTTALAAGSTIRDACIHAGISEDTYAIWMDKYSDFSDAVKKAQAQVRIGAIARIQKAGRGGTWQADAWYLERTDSANYGRKDTIKIEGGIDIALVNRLIKAIQSANMTPGDAFEELIREFEQSSSTAGNLKTSNGG